MNRRNRRFLVDGIARLELDLASERIELLVRYCDEISLWNRKMNLVGGTEKDLVIRHVLDSLAAVPVLVRSLGHLINGATVADVGSGAGFPGVPLAVALPEASFSLLERSARRAGFLTTIRLLLELENVEVTESDADTHDRTYDLVICRAYLPFERAIAKLDKLRSKTGQIAFFAATPPVHIKDEEGFIRTDVELRVPFLDAPRNLVILAANDIPSHTS